MFQWPVLSGDVFKQVSVCRFGIGIPNGRELSPWFWLSIKEHVGTCSNQKGTVCGPDRVRYTMWGQTAMNSNEITLRQIPSRLFSPPNLEFPARIPPMILVEICLPLLTYHLYMMAKSDRKDGLTTRRRGPIEIIDGFRYAVVPLLSEEIWEEIHRGVTHSNTLLNSSPLANSLSFESQIVNSSPSSRGTTGHVYQSRQGK